MQHTIWSKAHTNFQDDCRGDSVCIIIIILFWASIVIIQKLGGQGRVRMHVETIYKLVHGADFSNLKKNMQDLYCSFARKQSFHLPFLCKMLVVVLFY